MLLLDRQDVVELLPMKECMAAVERAFAAHAAGNLPALPGVLGTHVESGSFHVKTAAIGGSPATTPRKSMRTSLATRSFVDCRRFRD